MNGEADRQTFQLSYGDCDTVGIAYFAIYYPWMERTYSTWLYTRGIRAGELSDRFGVVTVGIRSQCQYFAPVRVFDALTCQLVIDHIGTSSYALGFDFLRGDEVVTHGDILFACRNLDGTKASIPEEIRAAMESLLPADATAQTSTP